MDVKNVFDSRTFSPEKLAKTSLFQNARFFSDSSWLWGFCSWPGPTP